MASTVLNAYVPFVNVRDDVIDPVTKLLAPRWQEWFLALWGCVNLAAQQRKRVTLTAQGASIGATPIPLAKIPEKLYRVSYFARITRAGSVSSSLIVGIRAIDGGVTYTISGAAMTGNAIGTVQSGVLLIKSDRDGPISYVTTYVDGGGATSMQYGLEIIADELPS